MMPDMTEYGGGISNGPAGQVGGAGTPQAGGGPDVFASVGHLVHDATTWVSSLPTEVLVVGIVAFFLGLIILKRAF
jgi:hypothetical protein